MVKAPGAASRPGAGSESGYVKPGQARLGLLVVGRLVAAFDHPVCQGVGQLRQPGDFGRQRDTVFGGDFETAADYRDPYLQKLIADKGGYMVWPPIRYSFDTPNTDAPTPAPSPPATTSRSWRRFGIAVSARGSAT